MANISKKVTVMTQEMRELLFRVADGHEGNRFLMVYLLEIRNCKFCIQMLKWLVANHLTGRNLINWILENRLMKPSEFVNEVVQRNNLKVYARGPRIV